MVCMKAEITQLRGSLGGRMIEADPLASRYSISAHLQVSNTPQFLNHHTLHLIFAHTWSREHQRQRRHTLQTQRPKNIKIPTPTHSVLAPYSDTSLSHDHGLISRTAFDSLIFRIVQQLLFVDQDFKFRWNSIILHNPMSRHRILLGGGFQPEFASWITSAGRNMSGDHYQ
jgi:hypothetical protein